MKTILMQVVPLAVVCSVLFGYQYLNAAWTEPGSTPPLDNMSVPINTGGALQIKNGALSVDELTVFGDMEVTGTTSLNRVHAAAYCDENGENCSSGGGGITVGVVTGETNGNASTAHTLCQSNGYDGFWGGMDTSGSETIMCYTSSVITSS